MKQLITFILRLTLLIASGWTTLVAEPAALAPGEGRFEFKREGKTVPVWYYLPENAGPDVPILFVMHGVNRDADRYRNEWEPHAKKYGFILVAPEFSRAEFPKDDDYSYGGTVDTDGRPRPRAQWAFSFIEPIFDTVKAATHNRSEKYSLYGHSAGAQFVHRYLYFIPEARVSHVVSANSGWWTLPDETVDFPYGLRGSVVDTAALKTMLQRPLVVLLGTADTDPNHVNLRRTPEAMAQGPHRFARGHFFYEAGKKAAAALGVPLGWKLATAPGIGHHDAGMAAFAVEWLFGSHQAEAGEPKISTPKVNAPTAGESAHVRVLVGGDTCFGESYQDEYARNSETNVLAQKGYEHGLVNLDRLLRAVDFRILNLETPLTTRHESPLKGKDYIHYSDPAKTTALFGRYGPIAVSLANNHTLDQGAAGLADTMTALQAANMRWIGAGRNLSEATQPVLQTCRLGDRSVHLAVFGAFEYRPTYDEDYHFYAGADRPGTAPVDVPAVQRAIAELRKTTPDVYVIYFVHWGENYKWKNLWQTTTAHALQEAGIDLVVGAHAHTMQEVEHDERGWIFYGVGNFLFNARGRYAALKAPPFSLPLVLDFTMKDNALHVVLRVYPILSDNEVTGYQPRFVNPQELSDIETLLSTRSKWSPADHAAVKQGADDIGPYLEFLPSSPHGNAN